MAAPCPQWTETAVRCGRPRSVWSDLYMGTVCHWQPFWATTRVQFIGQCWYFNPQWTAGQAIKKASCVWNSITHWNNCAVAMCWHMNQGFWRGWRGGGCPFWLHRETLTFKVPAAYQKRAVFQIGVNRIPPKFDTLFVTPLEVVWLFKGLTVWRLEKSFGIKGLNIAVVFLLDALWRLGG